MSYRVGVVSTDVDLGGNTVDQCHNYGGVLQDTPRIAGCAAPPNPWITGENVADPAASFQCIATLGENGCGFEQPLEAMAKAISPMVNPGFIRTEAALMVVFLTNEDDCSAYDSDLFNENAVKYGGFSSFRCFYHGIVCSGTSEDYFYCRTKTFEEDGPLYPVKRYVDQLIGAKGSLEDVKVIAVAGPTEPVRTGIESGNIIGVFSSCPGGVPDVEPGIRMSEFLNAVSGSLINLCTSSTESIWFDILREMDGSNSCRLSYACNGVEEGGICEPL